MLLKVRELADVVPFNRTLTSAEFAFLMEQALNAFVAFNAWSAVWNSFSRNGNL
jgi:hypothetical protein